MKREELRLEHNYKAVCSIRNIRDYIGSVLLGETHLYVIRGHATIRNKFTRDLIVILNCLPLAETINFTR